MSQLDVVCPLFCYLVFLRKYEYLIDATKEGSFIKAKEGSDYKILDSSDLSYLEEAQNTE